MNRGTSVSFIKDVSLIAVYPIGAVVVLVVLRSFSWWGFVILSLLTLVAVVVAAIAILISGAMAILRREWRKTAVWATALVLAAPAVLAARTATLPGDYVHLAVMYPYYAMRPEYRSGRPFVIPWTSEGFLLTQGCDRSMRFDPYGKTKTEERRVVPDAHSYYNWLSIQPLFLKFFVQEDCFF